MFWKIKGIKYIFGFINFAISGPTNQKSPNYRNLKKKTKRKFYYFRPEEPERKKRKSVSITMLFRVPWNPKKQKFTIFALPLVRDICMCRIFQARSPKVSPWSLIFSQFSARSGVISENRPDQARLNFYFFKSYFS